MHYEDIWSALLLHAKQCVLYRHCSVLSTRRSIWTSIKQLGHVINRSQEVTSRRQTFFTSRTVFWYIFSPLYFAFITIETVPRIRRQIKPVRGPQPSLKQTSNLWSGFSNVDFEQVLLTFVSRKTQALTDKNRVHIAGRKFQFDTQKWQRAQYRRSLWIMSANELIVFCV